MSLLSEDKVAEIKGVLAQVKRGNGGIAEICRKAGVKRRLLYAVLDGESTDYESLKKVIDMAKKTIKERQKKIQSL